MRLEALARRRFLQNDSGGAALEFALVAPLLLALCIFTVEAASVIIDYRRVVMAAEAGGDAAAVSPDDGEDGVERAAILAFGERGAANLQVSTTCEPGIRSRSQGMLTVQVSYASETNSMLGSAFRIAASSFRVLGQKGLCADYDEGEQEGADF